MTENQNVLDLATLILDSEPCVALLSNKITEPLLVLSENEARRLISAAMTEFSRVRQQRGLNSTEVDIEQKIYAMRNKFGVHITLG